MSERAAKAVQPGSPALPRSCPLEQVSTQAAGVEETGHVLKGRLHVLFVTGRGRTGGERGLGVRGDAMVGQTHLGLVPAPPGCLGWYLPVRLVA